MKAAQIYLIQKRQRRVKGAQTNYKSAKSFKGAQKYQKARKRRARKFERCV